MACYHPIRVNHSREGVYGNVTDTTTVGCGSCLGCLADQRRQWQIRLLHESTCHPLSWFLTLTYNAESIPEAGNLDPFHLRAFFRAVRRAIKDPGKPVNGRLSYFGCGEYGDRRSRPHYHALLFGPDILDRHLVRTDGEHRIWRSKTLEAAWGRGATEFGTVTAESAAYVAGYVRKKLKTSKWTRCNPATGEILHPPFARMSLRPAIGNRWIRKYWRDVYPRDYVVTAGYKTKPPRYYDRWMLLPHPGTIHEDTFDERREIMVDVKRRRIEEAALHDKRELRAREKHHCARSGLYDTRTTDF